MKIKCAALCAFILIASSTSEAGVIVNSTRVIFDGAKKETSLGIINSSKEEYLVQLWVDSDSSKNDEYIITPPLMKLEPEQKNIVRIIKVGNGLAQDRESLMWINIKSIPPKINGEEKNTLQIAVKSRIKLIYRPKSLMQHTPEEYTESLTWKVNGKSLEIYNPTDYVMNFSYVKVNNNNIDAKFVEPKSTIKIELPSNIKPTAVSWSLINDYGGIGKSHEKKIWFAGVNNASKN